MTRSTFDDSAGPLFDTLLLLSVSTPSASPLLVSVTEPDCGWLPGTRPWMSRIAPPFLSVSIFMTPAVTTLPTLGVVEVKLAPEATAIMADSIRMKRAPTTLRGEACHRAETRFMLCSVPSEPLGGHLGDQGPLSAEQNASLDFLTRTFVQSGRSLDGDLVHEAALHGPPAELVPVGELELAEHRRDVRLDGLRGDMEPRPDLLVEVAAGDVLEDLALARGQLVEPGIDRRRRVAGREGVEHEAREPRREDGVAAGHPAHRVGQL